MSRESNNGSTHVDLEVGGGGINGLLKAAGGIDDTAKTLADKPTAGDDGNVKATDSVHIGPFLTFPNHKEAQAYLLYMRSTYKFSFTNFGMMVCIFGVLIFRFIMESSPRYGPLFDASVVIVALTLTLMLLFVGAQLEKMHQRCHLCEQVLALLPVHAEDFIIVMIALCSSMNALFVTVGCLAVMGTGTDSKTVEAQTMRAAAAVPVEQLVLTLINSFILPIAFGAASKIGVFFTWLVGLAFLSAVEALLYARFPYLAICSHLFLLAVLYEIERNKMLIYNSYKVRFLAAPGQDTPAGLLHLSRAVARPHLQVADKTAGLTAEKEKKERMMRKREEIDRKLNEALLHAMVPKKVRLIPPACAETNRVAFPSVCVIYPSHRRSCPRPPTPNKKNKKNRWRRS